LNEITFHLIDPLNAARSGLLDGAKTVQKTKCDEMRAFFKRLPSSSYLSSAPAAQTSLLWSEVQLLPYIGPLRRPSFIL
jgi:hypothetical protein